MRSDPPPNSGIGHFRYRNRTDSDSGRNNSSVAMAATSDSRRSNLQQLTTLEDIQKGLQHLCKEEVGSHGVVTKNTCMLNFDNNILGGSIRLQ